MRKWLREIKARFRAWWPTAEPAVAVAGMLAAVMMSGCAAQLMGNAIDNGQKLSAEQIEAYNKVGAAVYGCIQVGGPPPTGNMHWLIVPKETKSVPRFTDNCHIISQ